MEILQSYWIPATWETQSGQLRLAQGPAASDLHLVTEEDITAGRMFHLAQKYRQ